MADDNNPVPSSEAPKPPEERPPTPPVEITLNPRALARPTTAPKKASDKSAEPKDSLREVVETIVFVVVLVLLLKTFLAEAFVIPTGSMATTLLGYHREVECEKCHYRFLVNASKECDPQEPHPQDVIGCTCPNCEFQNSLSRMGGLR
jgi:signal peptidase I